MMDDTQTSRLGEILLEKGLIDHEQLRAAIVEQQRRRQDLVNFNDKAALHSSSLGEVLIDLGYISRQQLKRGLSWQLYLRKMTLVMSLCAPLMGWMGGAHAFTSSSEAFPDYTQRAVRGDIAQPDSCNLTGRIVLKWDVPRFREDGSYLDISELGGYELRYRKLDDEHFTYVSINDPWKNYYQFRNLDGQFIVQVAAFDRNGLYSKFISVSPVEALI
jgi:hypothetical protein